MSKLSPLKAREVIMILRQLGFQKVRQKGSHAFFSHTDGRTTVVPIHQGKQIGRGLLRSIFHDIKISPDEFETLRRKH